MNQKSCGKCGVVLNTDGMILYGSESKMYIRCPVCANEIEVVLE